jgi:sensor histidine kinase YesM
MRRVYLIWTFRKAASPFGLELFAFAAIFSLALYHISFFDVMRNAFNSYHSFLYMPKFFLDNFLMTDLIHESIIVGLMVVVFILAWDLFRKRESHSILPHLPHL